MKYYLYRKKKYFKKKAWKLLRNLFRYFSLSIVPIKMGTGGLHYDLTRLLKEKPDGPLIIFDVGANKGQSSMQYAQFYHSSIVYAFEPDPDTFKELLKKTVKYGDRIRAYCLALGESESDQILYRTESSDGSSLLPVSETSKKLSVQKWITQADEILVGVTTIDTICKKLQIDQIDFLKIDTQGFESSVLKGALDMIREGRIKFLLIEVLFVPFYENQSDFITLYQFIKSNGFSLIDFYNQGYLKETHQIGWCDLLFKHDSVEY